MQRWMAGAKPDITKTVSWRPLTLVLAPFLHCCMLGGKSSQILDGKNKQKRHLKKLEKNRGRKECRELEDMVKGQDCHTQRGTNDIMVIYILAGK